MNEEQPLRLTHPNCYEHLLAQFSNLHLHSYDVKASSIAGEGGFNIILRYGEGLKQSKQQFFDDEALSQLAEQITLFYIEVAELCKKMLIADYYKLMKP